MTAEPAGVEEAPAKINLALHVRARRPDGYHALETVFAFTCFGDELVARPSADWSLAVEGPTALAAGPLEDNLVLRAARAFEAAAGGQRYALQLRKRIPVAAGLGGGSADAAATLRLLNRLAGTPLTMAALQQIGAGLGADVPACVRSRTQVGRGVGEVLDDLPPAAPPASGLGCLLVNPRVAVPTGPVFRGWDGTDRGPLGPDWRIARNDLEGPAVSLQPVIAETLGWLQSLPEARLVRMSGSGATCFALFDGPAPEVAPPADWWTMPTVLL